ncbi:MAG: sel1 repeat family protein [Nitrospinae bacterium]|nr:sel1 repeat family protein [Nitrospinota bacterium]
MIKTWLGLFIPVGFGLVLSAPGCADMPRQQDASQRSDYDTSLEELQSRAEQGHARAQFNLAGMFAEGLGVPQDFQEALRWAHLAAEQGLAIAQGKLGALYYIGEDVAQDYQEAAKWFHLAATQGNAKAQFNLGGMYYEGKGLPTDYVLAHLWLTRAAEQGFPKAVTLRETLEGVMIPEQLSEAQRLEAKGFMVR